MNHRLLLSVFVILLFTVSTAFSYTVILKNGKHIKGRYVSDSENAIVIQDRDGVHLTFRKTTLDLDAMQKSNAAKEDKEEAERKDTPAPVEKKPAKVFT